MKKALALLLALLLVLTCACTKAPASTPSPSANVDSSALGESLEVHYIDVGQADSVLIRLGDKSMLIDAGNVEDGPDVVRYIKQLGIKVLDTVVVTHAHEDHAGGMSNVIENFTVKKVYSPVKEYDSACFRRFVDSAEKQCGVTIGKRGMEWSVGTAQVKALWPIDATDEDTNNTSMVLKLTYGDISYLFTGDLEHDAETRLVEKNDDLSADVLKVGHHGSDTSSSYLFLRTVMPQIAVISVGEGNTYGHPHKEVLERYEQAEIRVFRTDEVGTVIISTDGKTLNARYGETNEELDKVEATPGFENVTYIGNINSKKFHRDSCSGLPKQENRVIFATRQDAVSDGYTPCGICKP